MLVTGGNTDVTAYFQMRLTAGGDATGLTITDFDLSYTRSGDTTSAKVDATALSAANSTHADNKMIEVDPTDCPGLYRVDWPDAAFVAGVREVILTVKHTSCFTESLRVEIDGEVNVTKISGDSTAADNLELMYDTTGYTDDTAPASRSQIDGISGSGGGALNFAVAADNTSSAIKGISSVGTPTGTFANLQAEDGSVHSIANVGNDIDWIYRFTIGGGRKAVELDFAGSLSSANDAMLIQAYDFVGADWETIAQLAGKGATSNDAIAAPLLSKHTGTGSDLGDVLIRFEADGAMTSPTLEVDKLLVEAVGIGQTVGYALGRIWVNTGGTANTNTENFVDGVADNKVSTIAAAKTLSTQLGIDDFHIINGSSITFAENTDNESYFGDNWTLALGNQSMASAHIGGATVSGIQTGSGVAFDHCEINNVTLADEVHLEECSFHGTITLPAGSIELFNCHHDGASLGVLDFGDAVGSTTVHMHSYHGGFEVQNMGDSGTDIIHLDGNGRLDINANSSGGTINVRGNWEINDNGASTTINYDDQRADTQVIKVVTDQQGNHVIGGTCGSGSTTTNVVSGLTTITDQFNGKVITFSEDTTTTALQGQSSSISDTDASGNLTVVALTDAPVSGDTYILT